jgi:hypothetical protein
MADTRKRLGSLSKERYRNLVQYKNLSDEEYDTVWNQMQQGIKKNLDLEIRIETKIKEFGTDYDLDDLKINDLLTLRALALTYITLEDYELYAYNLRAEGISLDKILEMEKLNNIMSGLRKDISNMQNDLNITRRIRKGDKEETVISEVERLKQKAKEFYEARMSYVLCEECNMLLATIWFHYPEENNKLSFKCNRVLDDGSKCNHITTVSSKDLMKTRGVNQIEVMPETFR